MLVYGTPIDAARCVSDWESLSSLAAASVPGGWRCSLGNLSPAWAWQLLEPVAFSCLVFCAAIGFV